MSRPARAETAAARTAVAAPIRRAEPERQFPGRVTGHAGNSALHPGSRSERARFAPCAYPTGRCDQLRIRRKGTAELEGGFLRE